MILRRYRVATRYILVLRMLVSYTVVGSSMMAISMVIQYVVIGSTYSLHSIEVYG